MTGIDGLGSDVVIFGYSDLGKRIYDHIKSTNRKIVYCDNSSEKQGMDDGVSVYSVIEAADRYPHADFILGSRWHTRQMREQLLGLGVNEEHIIDELPEEVYESDAERIRRIALTPRERISFEISINKGCNLNCRSCDHYAPLAENKDIDYEKCEKDVARMSYLFNGDAEQISIIGGEPLLNSRVTDYCNLCRGHFPRADIRMITNGLLLDKMDMFFWKSCADNDIVISVTRYPVSFDYEGLRDRVVDRGVRFEFCGVSEAGRTFWKEPLDLEGKQAAAVNFCKCSFGNVCIALEDGKLFTCIVPANIGLFNSYFGKNIEVTDMDYIDIYQVDSAREILERLAKPIPFCRYCNIDGRTYDNPFAVSKRSIEEWT